MPFFSISGSEFVEMFVGVGASRVRDLFEQAKQSAPCIVFIDEIDAVGRHRGAGLGGGHDEREQTLNQLLVEMDGFEHRRTASSSSRRRTARTCSIPRCCAPAASTARSSSTGPTSTAARRSSRSTRRASRWRRRSISTRFAGRTPGFTGADLANLVNEAALLAARRGKKLIEHAELEEAINRVIAGPERKTRVISEQERKIIAYHEIGHALVGALPPSTDPVHKVSIIPRPALGYTLQLPLEDRYLTTTAELDGADGDDRSAAASPRSSSSTR